MSTLFTIYGIVMNDEGISISFARDLQVDEYPDDTEEDLRERAINKVTEELGANIVIHTIEEDEI